MDAFEAVSLPDMIPVSGTKYFSAAEANRALPLVRRIVQDIVGNYQLLCELHADCQAFDAKGNLVRAEEARQKYAAVTDRLSELNEELDKIGCELKDYQTGLVDFPAQHAGHDIYLCWKLGEESVLHWHEIDAGFAGRRPITDDLR
jgi:hypothetical protein